MPSLNAIKPYVSQGIYHIYNRAVDKRPLFIDDQDHHVFLYLLTAYLGREKFPKKLNYSKDADLLAYCLMPNHFHLLLKQREDERTIARFMKSLTVSYSLYFNKKNKRTGALFENRYRGILVKEDTYLLHISKYIHLNPRKLQTDPLRYEFSSVKDYLGLRKTEWLDTGLITEYFKKRNADSHVGASSYSHFLKLELEE